MAFDYHSCGVLAFSTVNYEAMKKFLADLGFEITEGGDQLLPLFSGKRGVRVSRGDLRFQLEESDEPKHKALFNVFLTDYSDEEIERIKSLGYECDPPASPYGEVHSFMSPDGGTFVICG